MKTETLWLHFGRKAPAQFNAGWRLCHARIGRKWVRLKETHRDTYTKVYKFTFDRIREETARSIEKNGAPCNDAR